jgi:uncharacterized protein YukE
MGRKLKINWVELSNIGNDTNDIVVNLEKAKLRIQSILNSMDEGWRGIDSTAYVNHYNEVLNELENEVIQLLEWSEYFDRSSKKYSSSQEEAVRDIDKLKADLESMATKEDLDDESKGDI